MLTKLLSFIVWTNVLLGIISMGISAFSNDFDNFSTQSKFLAVWGYLAAKDSLEEK